MDATCSGEPVVATVLAPPLTELRYTGPQSGPEAPIRVSFRIDGSGRPVDITGIGTDYRFGSGDIGPALASSRFAPSARTGCMASYTPVRTEIGASDLATAIGYTIFITGATPPRGLFERVRPAGSTCFDPGPAVLNRAYPDFDTVPQAPGTLSWSMVGFDIDATGKPVRIHRVAGTGNTVLDAKAQVAVQQSRFGKGARRGCLYPYYRRGDPLSAPAIEIAKDWRPAGSTCPIGPTDWAKAPVYSFPDNYRRRGVEGWAVIQYDVAPWGEIGNMRVVAAQPTAAFGDSAIAVLRGARKPASSGYQGCVDRVRFVVRDSAVRTAPNEVVPID